MIFKSKKKKFETRTVFFRTIQKDEYGGRILLCQNRGGVVVMLWPIKFQCAGV